MSNKKKVALTLEQINENVAKRIATVKELLGNDFPMLEWYLGKYEDYYRKIQLIESLNISSKKIVYMVSISDIINIALLAPADAKIDVLATEYSDLLEKGDVYGFVLHLINDCGFEMMNNAYTFNAQGYVQAASHKRQADAEVIIASGSIPPESEDEKFQSFINSLNANQIKKFTNMIKQTELLEKELIEQTLDEDEKKLLELHNKSVTESIRGIVESANKNNKKKTTKEKTSDGKVSSNKQPEIVVLLSGYPSNEMRHRYVGIGKRYEMENLSKDIQVALDTGKNDIPYCGTVPDDLNKSKSQTKGIIRWLGWPSLYGFKTMDEARIFAAKFDPHYSNAKHIYQ